MSNYSPERDVSWKARAEAIDRLRLTMSCVMNDFEQDFCDSVRNRIVLTVKQQDYLNEIFHKYTGSPLIPVEGIEYPKNWNSPGYKHPYDR